MQSIADTLSQLALLWSGFFESNATVDGNALVSLDSYAVMRSDGFIQPSYFYSAAGKAVCVAGMVNVSVEASTIDILYPGPANNFELTEFITDFLRADSDTFSASIGSSGTVSGTFGIYSTLCVPANSTNTRNPTSVQFLAHGGSLDLSYWDFAPEYSYADAAADRGYATFSYDRLGTRMLDHPDPKQIVQVPLQAEIAHILIQKLKEGNIGGIAF